MAKKKSFTFEELLQMAKDAEKSSARMRAIIEEFGGRTDEKRMHAANDFVVTLFARMDGLDPITATMFAGVLGYQHLYEPKNERLAKIAELQKQHPQHKWVYRDFVIMCGRCGMSDFTPGGLCTRIKKRKIQHG